MLKAGEGVLRLPAQSFELGGVLVERANRFLAERPGAEDALRRVLTLKLATVREDGEPTRRRELRAEFSDEEWRLVSDLAGYPNRLLVTATTEAGETYAEVAHEAIFKRWDKLKDWISAEREFLAWRTGLEAARGAWQDTPDASKPDALLMGAALVQAQSCLARRPEGLSDRDRKFIVLSIERDRKARGRARNVRALVYVMLVGIIVGLVAWINQSYISEQWRSYAIIRPFLHAKVIPYVKTGEAERALRPGDSFRECAPEHDKDYCPEMVVASAGSFMMGSPPSETGGYDFERPQHHVNIAMPFAVSKLELTFDEWDTCVGYGDCPQGIPDSGFGRGQRPAINVSWDDAQTYVNWLSRITGKAYRLLSESEYEYAARAGTQWAYPWGDDVKLKGKPMANCASCGSQWDNKQTAPVGSFPANRFGLYDMVGNVWEWTQDCWNESYQGAPADGSPWTSGDCSRRVVRGGSWGGDPGILRSAYRVRGTTDYRDYALGFRVARTLTP